MNRPSLKLAFVALGAALLAWVGVFFFVQSVHSAQALAEKEIRALREVNTSEESRNQMLAVFNATEVPRRKIEESLHIDVLTLARMVEGVGEDVGVALRVANAVSEQTPIQNKAAAGSITVVQFTIEARGSFALLAQALALLEQLPIPSKVEEVSFMRMESDEAEPWMMKVRLRILTALPVNA